MAAFNLLRFQAQCPVCRQETSIAAQVHSGASFAADGGGRFCNAEYRVGDRIHWWDAGHPGYRSWPDEGAIRTGVPDTVRECCYATCAASDDKLYAIVEISDLVLGNVIGIGPEEDWPAGYAK